MRTSVRIITYLIGLMVLFAVGAAAAPVWLAPAGGAFVLVACFYKQPQRRLQAPQALQSLPASFASNPDLAWADDIDIVKGCTARAVDLRRAFARGDIELSDFILAMADDSNLLGIWPKPRPTTNYPDALDQMIAPAEPVGGLPPSQPRAAVARYRKRSRAARRRARERAVHSTYHGNYERPDTCSHVFDGSHPSDRCIRCDLRVADHDAKARADFAAQYKRNMETIDAIERKLGIAGNNPLTDPMKSERM